MGEGVLSAVEQTRLKVSRRTDAKRKSQLGQFLTPAGTAQFMAGLFVPTGGRCRLLDPGAGIGSLSVAFVERWFSGGLSFDRLDLAAFEIDPSLHAELDRTLAGHAKAGASSKRLPFTYEISGGDFVEEAVNRLQFGYGDGFTHAILNPPYKKINNESRYRLLLRQAGIETVNLYSAFVALALALLAPGGQLVAIIPRSFCNGPYYRPFRDFVLARAAIRHIHLFESRSQAFKDDGVLQENVIILLERDGKQEEVTVSTSTDDRFEDLVSYRHPFQRILFPDDPERFIHVPTSAEIGIFEHSAVICHTLDDIGVKVSTGPVVDFRLREHLRDMPEAGTVPLLYPGHFGAQCLEWPKPSLKKPNAIQRNAETEKWLYPNGFYCVVRRFSSKEERRRIVASLLSPANFPEAGALGIENHLNLFHDNKQGLPETLARGLSVFLNSTAVDESFRRFNGHTQVNATDLKRMKYPSRAVLMELGEWAKGCGEPTQAMIDQRLSALLP